jgi:hypothetical protein
MRPVDQYQIASHKEANMRRFFDLFNLVSGKPLPEEEKGDANRMLIVIRALLASVFFAAIWGLAAGSADLATAFSNVYKVPMVLLLSALCALPAGLLAWKLFSVETRATDLVISLAACNFTATLVLAVLAPVVALYYHTSGYLGGVLAMGACILALLVGWIVMVLSTVRRAPVKGMRLSTLVPAGIVLMIHAATLVQFIHLASPILPEITVFDGGMDAVLGG